MSHCRYTIFPQEYTPSRRLQTPSITYLSMFFTVPILFVFECIGFRYLRSKNGVKKDDSNKQEIY